VNSRRHNRGISWASTFAEVAGEADLNDRLELDACDQRENTSVIAVGYLFKRMALRPEWIKKPTVKDIYSVSNHGSEDFADYIKYWKHNGWWLFNRPSDIEEIIQNERVDQCALTLFYFEVFHQEYDGIKKRWSAVEPDPAFVTEIDKPLNSRREGFDVVSYSVGNLPECSPLCCNSLADEIDVNEHCLIDSFETAKALLESGRFDNSEPGPFRIFAVYTV
jgi:hypothetical protein